MKRLATDQLLRWKNRPQRKPMLIDGARQVGKSFLAEKLFGAVHFAAVHKMDFLAEPGLASIFDDGLDPKRIISNIELLRGARINLETDLVLFDEIGECPQAVSSLKYFAENLPRAFLCATGSNMGLLSAFPVGKTEMLELFPMCFEEFVMASGNQPLLAAFRARAGGRTAFDALWPLLLDHYFVGGMPEAVATWFQGEGSPLERSRRVREIHHELLNGYQRDFGKYSGRERARHIESVFLNIPRQMSRVMDGSVRRYRFSDVVEKKKRYAELGGPISWLEKAKLASKCYQLEGRPTLPFNAMARENTFKLFLFDIGLLGSMLGMDYRDQQAQKLSHKGFIAENFVQNELRTRVAYPTYSWATANAEIEFLHKGQDGGIIPVEVKSSSRTRARSLRSFVQRYSPEKTVKLIGAPGKTENDDPNLVWPLYYAQFLGEL